MDGIAEGASGIYDDLMQKDKGELADRVIFLEKKTKVQDEEINDLRIAMAELGKRMGALEGKQGHKGGTALRSGPVGNSLQPVRGSNGATPRAYGKRPEHSKRGPTKKIPAGMKHQQPLPGITKTPEYDIDEATVRLYLKGRPVSLFAPSTVENYTFERTGETPQEKLKLDWVYGYRGRDCRSNLHLLPTGEMVYFIAAAAVLYNVDGESQRHYTGHTDDIKCLAIHPDKVRIATGQVAGHDRKAGRKSKRFQSHSNQEDSFLDKIVDLPHVRVWDSVSLETLHVIGVGTFERAVAFVAFSKSDGGDRLVAVDEANDHNLSVWDWSNGDSGKKITDIRSSTDPVLVAEFNPMDEKSIITCGKSHICFWTLENGKLEKKTGIYERYDKPKYVLCIAFSENGDIISGDSNGNIFIWGRDKGRISRAITNAHEGPVFSLLMLSDGTLLSGGGRDRKINTWDRDYEQSELPIQIPEATGAVRTMAEGKSGILLVGTTRNCILQGSLDGGEFTPVVQAHTDELWGLTVNPKNSTFLTCGYDKNILLWDTDSHSLIWTKSIEDGCQSACFYPSGKIVAIGTLTGRWLVLDVQTRELIYVHTDGREQHDVIKYSPDGIMLAIGSHDNYIYIYSVTNDGHKYSKVGRCSGHTSFVTHLDWSADSKYLQTNSGDYELLFWDSSNCRQITASADLRDVDWYSQNCVLGFSVLGVWQEGADGTDVNTADRSTSKTLLATGDDFGRVNLFTYPCSQPKSPSHPGLGHSSHVTCVRFLENDSHLITTGGKDMSIMQWKIV